MCYGCDNIKVSYSHWCGLPLYDLCNGTLNIKNNKIVSNDSSRVHKRYILCIVILKIYV